MKSRENLPWFKMYTGDFLLSTAGLNAATVGVYTLLICMMLEEEKPLRFSDELLARRCGCNGVKVFNKHIDKLVEHGLVHREDGYLWSVRAQHEVEDRRRRREANRKNGARGAQIRLLKQRSE